MATENSGKAGITAAFEQAAAAISAALKNVAANPEQKSAPQAEKKPEAAPQTAPAANTPPPTDTPTPSAADALGLPKAGGGLLPAFRERFNVFRESMAASYGRLSAQNLPAGELAHAKRVYTDYLNDFNRLGAAECAKLRQPRYAASLADPAQQQQQALVFSHELHKAIIAPPRRGQTPLSYHSPTGIAALTELSRDENLNGPSAWTRIKNFFYDEKIGKEKGTFAGIQWGGVGGAVLGFLALSTIAAGTMGAGIVSIAVGIMGAMGFAYGGKMLQDYALGTGKTTPSAPPSPSRTLNVGAPNPPSPGLTTGGLSGPAPEGLTSPDVLRVEYNAGDTNSRVVAGTYADGSRLVVTGRLESHNSQFVMHRLYREDSEGNRQQLHDFGKDGRKIQFALTCKETHIDGSEIPGGLIIEAAEGRARFLREVKEGEYRSKTAPGLTSQLDTPEQRFQVSRTEGPLVEGNPNRALPLAGSAPGLSLPTA